MGLTMEQQNERDNDEDLKKFSGKICDCNGDKSYVFISYKSDDWEIVLKDIVYRLVMDYGLNVYFDRSFNTHNDLWTEQFKKNMADEKCKGVVAFIDDKYATSYATLLELMYSQAACQNTNYTFIEKEVVKVYLVENLKIIDDESDTGLGTDIYEDGTRNENAKNEKKLFDKTFDKAVKKEIFYKTEDAYDEVKRNKSKLTKKLCSAMVVELLEYIEHQRKNYYKSGGNLDDIAKTIRNACGMEVFGDGEKFRRMTGKSMPSNDKREADGKDAPKPITEPNATVDTPQKEIPSPVKDTKPPIQQPASEPVLPQGALSLYRFQASGSDAQILFDEEENSKQCIVLKGSKFGSESRKFKKNCQSAYKMKKELLEKGILKDNILTQDYACNMRATVINMIGGGSYSTPDLLREGTRLKKIKEGINYDMNSMQKNAPAPGVQSAPDIQPASEEGQSVSSKKITGTGRGGSIIEIEGYTCTDAVDGSESYAKVFDKYIKEENVATAYAVTLGFILAKYPQLSTLNDKWLTENPEIAKQYRASKEISCGGKTYYVKTLSSTDEKKKNVESIVEKLGIPRNQVEFHYSTNKGSRSGNKSQSEKEDLTSVLLEREIRYDK